MIHSGNEDQKENFWVDFCPVCFDIQRKESRISKKESCHEECFVFKSDDHQADKTKVTLMQNVIVKVFLKILTFYCDCQAPSSPRQF